jgi:hypothetical protein
MGDRAQGIINRQIVDSSDILFGVFWHRVGTPTGEARSGTIEEIERSVSAQRPVFLYFSQAPVPMSHEPTQLAAVRKYKSRMQKQGVAFDFPNDHEFRRMVSRHLAAKMSSLIGTTEPLDPAADAATAKVSIETTAPLGVLGTKGGKRVMVLVVIENLARRESINDWHCTIALPKDCLAPSEFHRDYELSFNNQLRVYRWPEDEDDYVPPIPPKGKRTLFNLAISVEHLSAKGGASSRAVDAALRGEIIVNAHLDKQHIVAERTVADVLGIPL